MEIPAFSQPIRFLLHSENLVAQNRSGTCFGMLIVRNNNFSINKNPFKAGRILMRIGKSSTILNRFRIKNHKISRITFSNLSPPSQTEGCRRERGHPTHRILQRQNLLLPHIAGQSARVVSISTRMGNSRTEGPHAAISRDHRIRMLQKFAQIFLVHRMKNSGSAPFELEFENEVNLGTEIVATIFAHRCLRYSQPIQTRIRTKKSDRRISVILPSTGTKI